MQPPQRRMINLVRRALRKLPFQPRLKKIYQSCPSIMKIAHALNPVNDYNAYNAQTAANYLDIRGKIVLVIGCNTGKDCRLFLDLGAREVHGVDVIDEVGAEFTHPQVTYHKISAESMDLLSGLYDLVYCFATMEHVPRIDLAFPEMVRVAKPGGIIYCVSAPLWNSRQGHHKGGFFDSYPWIHLRLTKDEIIEYCRANNITDPTGKETMEQHVGYMLDTRFFNKVDAAQYVKVCNGLRDVEILSNELALDEEKFLTPEIYAELGPKGYLHNELLASKHTFVAKKLKAAKI